MATFTITSNAAQDAAIAYYAGKAGQTAATFVNEGVMNWLNACISQMEVRKIEEVKEKYERADTATKLAVDNALKAVSVEPIVEEIVK
jgi:hypothetical protein